MASRVLEEKEEEEDLPASSGSTMRLKDATSPLYQVGELPWTSTSPTQMDEGQPPFRVHP